MAVKMKFSKKKNQEDDECSLHSVTSDEPRRSSKSVRTCCTYLPVVLLTLYTIPMVSLYSIVSVSSGIVFNNDLCHNKQDYDNTPIILSSVSTSISELLVFLAYPIAGWLADTKYGRFQVITLSLWLMWLGMVTLVMGTTLYPGMCAGIVTDSIGRFILIPVSIILLGASATLFFPNILAFIMDQLIDVPNSKLGSAVRWFAWATFVGLFFAYILLLPYVFQPIITYQQFPIITLALTLVCSIVLIVHFFTGQYYTKPVPNPHTSPYRIVMGVLKFTIKHKVPVNRSALTYWEADTPKRIDLAKEKYGGPYTTENVEDVKTFGRIMFFILALCIYYLSFASMSTQMLQFLQHLNYSNNLRYNEWIIYLLDPLITILCIPVLELIVLPLFPKFEYVLTKFFIWMGLGMASMLISTISIMIIDLVTHITSANKDYICFLQWTIGTETESFPYGWVAIPAFFWGLSDLLVAPSIFCFICSQSPYHMRGMILGLFMLMQEIAFYGGGQIGFIFTIINIKFPFSCGVWYWGLQAVLSGLGIIAYLIAVHFYKNRERQEVEQHVRIIEDIYTQRIEEQAKLDDKLDLIVNS